MLDDKISIICGETRIKKELLLFDKLKSKISKDEKYIDPGYGKQRYGRVLKACR